MVASAAKLHSHYQNAHISKVIQAPNEFFYARKAPLILLDYVWVITLYFMAAFWLAVLIDGYILPSYNEELTKQTSTPLLFVEVILQIALQGFIAILIHAVLEDIPSPVNNLFGYNQYTAEGNIIRNPAIISVILFALSKSLQGRLSELFSRFNKNAGHVVF